MAIQPPTLMDWPLIERVMWTLDTYVQMYWAMTIEAVILVALIGGFESFLAGAESAGQPGPGTYSWNSLSAGNVQQPIRQNPQRRIAAVLFPCRNRRNTVSDASSRGCHRLPGESTATTEVSSPKM